MPAARAIYALSNWLKTQSPLKVQDLVVSGVTLSARTRISITVMFFFKWDDLEPCGDDNYFWEI